MNDRRVGATVCVSACSKIAANCNWKYELKSDGDNMLLIIATTHPSDSAIYRCEAANRFGHVQTECYVQITSTWRRQFVS